jgi:uncharacterized protein YggT (Ycf19 family)
MANVNDLAENEAHRISQHEAVKDEIRSEVHNEISDQALRANPQEQQQAAMIGQQMREKTFDEVSNTEAEVSRARAAARISQIIDFIFYIVYSLIGLQILLDLMGARRGTGFRRFIDTLSAPLLGPFESLIQSVGVGRYQLELSYVFAFIVYAILHAGINSLLRMLTQRKTTI